MVSPRAETFLNPPSDHVGDEQQLLPTAAVSGHAATNGRWTRLCGRGAALAAIAALALLAALASQGSLLRGHAQVGEPRRAPTQAQLGPEVQRKDEDDEPSDEDVRKYGFDENDAGEYEAYCVIDVARSLGYLGEAVTYSYRSWSCPDETPLGCTDPVPNVLTAFLWVGAFVSESVYQCNQTLLTSYKATCARNVLRDLSASGSVIFGIEEDCYLTDYEETEYRVFSGRRRLGRRLRTGHVGRHRAFHHKAWAAVAKKIASKKSGDDSSKDESSDDSSEDDSMENPLEEIMDDSNQNLSINATIERNFDKAQCAWDGVNSVSWLTEAALKIRESTIRCVRPGKFRCALKVVELFAALGYASQFMCEMAVDCPFHGQREALCGADISETIASFLLAGAGVATVLDDCMKAMRLDVPPGGAQGGLLALR